MSSYDEIHKAKDLPQAVYLSLGAASSAWVEYQGERKFDDHAIAEIGHELMHYVVQHFDSVLQTGRSKGEKIVADCLFNDEPFFVFRARDIFSVMVLKRYLQVLEEYGPDDPDMHADVVDFIGTLRIWQQKNIDKVRYPD